MSTVSGLDIANNIEKEWRVKCDTYINLLDSHVKELDRVMELLRRAETEMRYAGWTKLESDNTASSQERRRGFNQGYKQAIKGCVDLLMLQHEAAKWQHNYWHVAANLIEAEYGVHSDD